MNELSELYKVLVNFYFYFNFVERYKEILYHKFPQF